MVETWTKSLFERCCMCLHLETSFNVLCLSLMTDFDHDSEMKKGCWKHETLKRFYVCMLCMNVIHGHMKEHMKDKTSLFETLLKSLKMPFVET